MSFRDRFYTPRVAKAMMSPSGIGAAVGGATAGFLVTSGPTGAAIGAVVGWVARVGIAVPRRERKPTTRIDPFSLGERWNRLVSDAQQAQQTFDQTLRGTPKGPLRDRLEEIRSHIAASVVEVWEIAKAGNTVESGRARINRPAIERELAETQRMRSDGDTPSLAATEKALLIRLATADDLDDSLSESVSRLRLLNARLDEAVTRAIELSVSQADATATGTLRADVAGIVDEMEALRQAMVEVRAVDATVPKALPDLGAPDLGAADLGAAETADPAPEAQPPQTQPPQAEPPGETSPGNSG